MRPADQYKEIFAKLGTITVNDDLHEQWIKYGKLKPWKKLVTKKPKGHAVTQVDTGWHVR